MKIGSAALNGDNSCNLSHLVSKAIQQQTMTNGRVESYNVQWYWNMHISHYRWNLYHTYGTTMSLWYNFRSESVTVISGQFAVSQQCSIYHSSSQ